MPEYSISTPIIRASSGSVTFIPSGSKTDPTTAISASIPQILAITCSSNFENRLTKLSTINAFGIIALASSSNDTRLVLRYLRSSSLSSNNFIKDNEIATNEENPSLDLRFSGSKLGDTVIDIPLNNNDDSFVVAYRTVEALNNSNPFNVSFSASLVDDGSGLTSLTSSVGNMSIGTGFQIRNSASLKDGIEGKFLIHSLRSGAVANPDFTGTQPEVGGMQVGTSFKIGSSEPTFKFQIIQSGSGKMNQPFFEGIVSDESASLIQRIDPIDNKSFQFFIPSQSFGLDDDLFPFYISSSGKIGIGTDDPKGDLDIRGSVEISSNLNVSGAITAKEFHTEFFSSSILFESGSTIFGNSPDDTHKFTGNIFISGSGAGHITASGNIVGTRSSFSQSIITLESGVSTSPFIIKVADDNGQDEKLQVNNEGVLRFGALDSLPTAITGGLVYSASSFYVGLT